VTDNGAAPAATADSMPIDMNDVVAALQTLHAQQLASANMEAARWRAAATRAQAQLVELHAELATARVEPVTAKP
jgi:hypothetical protein